MKIVNRFVCMAFVGACAFCVASIAGAATVKQQVVGYWTLVSLTNTTSGKTTQPLGAHPIGFLMLDRSGHVAGQTQAPDLPKFASGIKNNGTDAENRAVVQGITTYFGTYTVDEKNHMLIEHVAGSSFPNWAGTDLKPSIEVKGDQLMLHNPAGPNGGVTTLVYQRAK